MPIVPETRVGKIDFYNVHVPVWAQDPASIGLTGDAVDQLRQLVDEAQAAFVQHLAAEQAALAATQRFHGAVRRMHAGGGGVVGGATLLQIIKAYAQTTGDDGVYTRASIPAPTKPGRPGSAPAPGRPYRFTVKLHQIGEIELTWKCDNPDGTAGTIYQVRRAVDDGRLAVLAMVGEKRLLDRTLPPGTKTCTYEVTAVRSTGKGASASYTFQFGNAHPIPEFAIKPRRLVA